MIEQLKASKEIKVHLKSGQGHFVVGNKLTSFNLNEIDDVETVKYIIENGEQEQYLLNIMSEGIYEYIIDNGYDYEMNDHTSVFSQKYFTDEEFKEMCEKTRMAIAEENGKDSYETRSIYTYKRKLPELYPDTFINIECAAYFCPNTDLIDDDD